MTADWVTAHVNVADVSCVDAQWLHILVGVPAHGRALARYLTAEGTTARVIRGHKSRTTDRFFDEIGAVLQFPDHFGENWAALADCIEDMSWLPADAYALVVTNGDQLLADEPERSRQVLLKILDRAATYWSADEPEGGKSWPHGSLPFHVVLQASETGVPQLTQTLSALGRTYSVLNET